METLDARLAAATRDAAALLAAAPDADAHVRAQLRRLVALYKALKLEHEVALASVIAEASKCNVWNVNFASPQPLITNPLEQSAARAGAGEAR
jgi:hypothetical protein